MRVLLTGATGFIGSYVYKKLIRSNIDLHTTSRVLTSNLQNCHSLDILDHENIQELIRKIKPDVLIHLAWDLKHSEFWTAVNNKDYKIASVNLFESFIASGGKKIIAAGTCAEYPLLPEAVLEDGVYDDCELTLYGKYKREVFEYLKSKQYTASMEFTWFRVFGLFGVGENENRFFPTAIRSLRYGQTLPIKTPDAFYDYVYVDDLAHFIVACINKDGLGPINIGTGQSLAMLDIYKTIESYMKDNRFEIIKTIGTPDKNSRIPDCQKLKNLGFDFSFQNGLENMISTE